MTRIASQPGRPLIFGEVLYDEFPDGNAVLGGAPFNVAWHLQGFGRQPLFISRVGRDTLGERVLDTLRDFGMDARGVQLDARHPTGRVKITLKAGQPSFNILPDQAYDRIDADAALASLAGVPGALLYHGSLATRDEVSRAALLKLRAADVAPVFVDVNLRDPWWNEDTLERLLQGARWVKLNDVELARLSHSSTHDSPVQVLEAAQAFRKTHDLELLIITLGAQGARLIGADLDVQAAAPAVTDIVDTVGAGDAFSSVMLNAFMQGWPLELALRRALDFAAAICRQRGATSQEHRFYDNFTSQWST